MEKIFKYIFKGEDGGYFRRTYTLKDIANGDLLRDISSFLNMGCEIVAEGLQYIGMKDCDGSKIFERDILKLQMDRLSEVERKVYDPIDYEVVYRESYSSFAFKVIGEERMYSMMTQNVVDKTYRVIGNACEDEQK